MKIKTERYFKFSDSYVRAIDTYRKSLVIFLSKNGDAISAAKSFRYLDSTDRRVRLELIESNSGMAEDDYHQRTCLTDRGAVLTPLLCIPCTPCRYEIVRGSRQCMFPGRERKV